MFIAAYNQLELFGRPLMMKSVALHRLFCPPTAHGYVSELFAILVNNATSVIWYPNNNLEFVSHDKVVRTSSN
jgi:hypothetical protein